MPRPPRIHVPGAFYHVTLRGNHRQDIFFSNGDRQFFNGLVAQTIEQFGAKLHAYCLMTNHVHLLIQVADIPLGHLILRIAGPYARHVQRNLETTGHLFEKRYHSDLVATDEYLMAVLRYIHLNPVHAGMVANVSDYRWSSHHAYVGLRCDPWVTTDFLLSIFHEQRDRSVAAYTEFVDRMEQYPSDFPFKEGSDSCAFGNDQFLAKSSGHAMRHRSNRSLAGIIDEASAIFGFPAAVLRSSSRCRDVTKVRAWIAHRAVRLGIASMSEIARYLGRTEGALRQCVKRHFKDR